MGCRLLNSRYPLLNSHHAEVKNLPTLSEDIQLIEHSRSPKAYSLNQYPGLTRFCDDGQIALGLLSPTDYLVTGRSITSPTRASSSTTLPDYGNALSDVAEFKLSAQTAKIALRFVTVIATHSAHLLRSHAPLRQQYGVAAYRPARRAPTHRIVDRRVSASLACIDRAPVKPAGGYTMSTVILKGEEAIHYAEVHHMTLNEYADETHGPIEGLSVAEARRIQDEHRGHLWIRIEAFVNSADYSSH